MTLADWSGQSASGFVTTQRARRHTIMISRAGTWGLRRVGIALLGVALLVGLLPQSLAAQAVTGTILGTVKDASGAVVAGAKVVLTNEGTQYSRTVTSDALGEYVAPQLPT